MLRIKPQIKPANPEIKGINHFKTILRIRRANHRQMRLSRVKNTPKLARKMPQMRPGRLKNTARKTTEAHPPIMLRPRMKRLNRMNIIAFEGVCDV